MRRIIWICCLCLFLSSCSVPLRVSDKGLEEGGKPVARLLNIRIERWGEVRFSGLLALREQGEQLYYALLDPTGVKLLEVVVDSDGEYRILHAKGVLQDSSLGGFLSEVLIRIYRQEPAVLPCAGTWLYQLCIEQGDGTTDKYSQIGPLTLWRITAVPARQGVDYTALTYNQPWIGVAIFLEPTKLSK